MLADFAAVDAQRREFLGRGAALEPQALTDPDHHLSGIGAEVLESDLDAALRRRKRPASTVQVERPERFPEAELVLRAPSERGEAGVTLGQRPQGIERITCDVDHHRSGECLLPDLGGDAVARVLVAPRATAIVAGRRETKG